MESHSSDDETEEQKKSYDRRGNARSGQVQAEIARLVDSTNFCDLDPVIAFLVLRPRNIPIC